MTSVFIKEYFIDNKIATVKAIYNSAVGVNRYSNKFKAKIINSIGEWNHIINEKNSENFKIKSLIYCVFF